MESLSPNLTVSSNLTMSSNLSSSLSSPTSLSEGAAMVVSEMSLSVLAIVLNLAVLISVRERESLLNSTTNVLLANISLANLVSAVFVKSIAVIYNGYAVAKQVWHVQLAFCTLHTLSFRATWAAFPFTLVAIAYHQLTLRIDRDEEEQEEEPHSIMAASPRPGSESHEHLAMVRVRSKQASVESQKSVASRNLDMDDQEEHKNEENQDEEEEEENEDDDYAEGLNSQQKGLLTAVWAMSLVYATLSEQVVSKERTALTCPLRHSLHVKFNLISLALALLLPLLTLVLFCPLAHLIIGVSTLCSSKENRTNNVELDPFMQLCLTLVFLLCYPLHMLVSELFIDDFFVFMMSKYCVGCAHLVLAPVVTLATMADIRAAALDVALKRQQHVHQHKDFQQIQAQLAKQQSVGHV